MKINRKKLRERRLLRREIDQAQRQRAIVVGKMFILYSQPWWVVNKVGPRGFLHAVEQFAASHSARDFAEKYQGMKKEPAAPPLQPGTQMTLFTAMRTAK